MRRSSGRGATRSVQIPPEMDVGVLIGKKGSNIKDVSARSGARRRVDGDAKRVYLSGSSCKSRSS